MSPDPREGSSRSLVVVPEYLPPRHLDVLGERAEVHYDPDLHGDRDLLLSTVVDASAVLIRNRTIVDSEFLTAARQLQIVGRLGVGLDNIDVAAVEEAGVELVVAHGGNAVSVAEYVIGAMLVCQRSVFGMTPSMLAGRWPSAPPGGSARTTAGGVCSVSANGARTARSAHP